MEPNATLDPQVPVQSTITTPFSVKNIILGAFTILILMSGAFFLGRQSTKSIDRPMIANPTSMPSPTQMTPQSIPQSAGWLKYEFNGFQNTWTGWIWKPFIIYYPPTWSISENIKDETNLSFKLTLKKDDGSRLTITQGFGEGGRCLFQDDSDAKTFNGMGMPVARYIEIQRQDDIWRLSTVNSTDVPKSYILCGKNLKTSSQYVYGMNDVGISDVYYATDESGQELVEMLKRIEVK